MKRYFVLWKYKDEPDEFWNWRCEGPGHESLYEACKEIQKNKERNRDYILLDANELRRG